MGTGLGQINFRSWCVMRMLTYTGVLEENGEEEECRLHRKK